MSNYEKILDFWFGKVEETILPTEYQARVWFGEDPDIDGEIKGSFQHDLEKAILGQYSQWEETPRGQLALIILLDQFSRHIYRNTPLSFAQDRKALDVCVNGIRNETEHHLSLIERVFFYFPLLHSEQLGFQEQAMRSYYVLEELAFSETKVIYESFLKFANHHYSVIKKFGRFPQRNAILGRPSTEDELNYLREIGE